MTLGFKKYFYKDITPTFFAEKIITGCNKKLEEVEEILYKNYNPLNNYTIISLIENLRENKYVPKIHTIREDKKNKWKKGIKIHPVYFNRTNRRLQFAELDCISVQKFEIKYNMLRNKSKPFIFVNDFMMFDNQIAEIAKNDGFDNLQQFFNYFNTDFTGKIIHFTDLKYK